MANVGSVAVARDVGGPFEFRDVGVAGADVARLELFELLGCAQFVCLGDVSRGKGMVGMGEGEGGEGGRKGEEGKEEGEGGRGRGGGGEGRTMLRERGWVWRVVERVKVMKDLMEWKEP